MNEATAEPLPHVTEADFLPDNAIPLDQEARDERKLRRLAQNPTKVLVKGGKRVVKLKVNVPIDQYAGLQRFEGVTDSEKINTILRMANRRVDEVAREQKNKRIQGAAGVREALFPKQEPGSKEALAPKEPEGA